MRTSMTWGDTHALGSISLAIVPNPHRQGRRRRASARTSSRAADGYMELIQKQGYRLPFGVPKNGYPWGSNSFVVNNALIIALAHDFTKDGKYLNGVVMGMDYVLGRNALDQSYVTGYGDRPLENPHHRFWCAPGQRRSTRRRRRASCRAARTPASRIPYMQAAGLHGLRAAEVLHGQQRGLVGERGHHQLERAAVLGGGVSGREGRPARGEGRRQEEVGQGL